MSRRLSGYFADTIPIEAPTSTSECKIPNGYSKAGGLFLDNDNNNNNILPHYMINFVSPENNGRYCSTRRSLGGGGGVFRRKSWGLGSGFLSVSLSVKGSSDGSDRDSSNKFVVAAVGGGGSGGGGVVEEKKKVSVRLRRKPAAMNTTKHLWAGAVAAMVSSLLGYEGLEVINPEGGTEDAEMEAQRGRWKQEERDSYWRSMQKYVGADITSMVTLPVLIFEPMTMLQKMAELMEYSHLLELADKREDPYMD